MLFHKLCQAALLSVAAIQTSALSFGGNFQLKIREYEGKPLQDIVTWDPVRLFRLRKQRVGNF